VLKPFDAYPQPSPQTKATFETKTSAINVTPSSNSQYDIKEIKEDALWLSNTAKIDEVSALRVVVEECQSRTSALLLSRFSEEELLSIREAAGNSKYSSSLPVSYLALVAEPDAIQKTFETQTSRRQRILRTYLSERRHLLKCAEQLLYVCRFETDAGQENGKGKGLEIAPKWQVNCGRRLESKLSADNGDPFVLRCIKAIATNVSNLHTGSGWSLKDVNNEEIEMEWIRNQFAEATHAMEFIWHVFQRVMAFPSSQVVLEWYRLQQSCGFFSNFETVRSLKL